MSYLSVIPLADAKLHLRVDDTLTEDDAAITRMISTALSFVEKWTHVFVYERTHNYAIPQFGEGCYRLYDYPVNSTLVVDGSLVPISNVTFDHKNLYTLITPSRTPATIIAQVGYTSPANVPQGLIDVALEIIDILYYSNETGKTVQKDLSPMSIMILDQNKRFLI